MSDRMLMCLQPVVKEEFLEGKDLRSLTFDTTPIMSTYLLAFVVGEFDYVEAKDSDGVLIRVYTPLEKQEQGKFALEVNELSVIQLPPHGRKSLAFHAYGNHSVVSV